MQAGVGADECLRYFEGLGYGLGLRYLAGLTEFFARLKSDAERIRRERSEG